MKYKIDFVLTWVDGGDRLWQAEKKKYEEDNFTKDTRNIRYRGLDNLQFWFRGIEKYTPWVNKIHFVTWGHVPEWLNINHPKLNIVRHIDFIPEKYLPTFSSHTIELNLHRIEGLAEKFIYFNDDTFIIKKMTPKDFFEKELPKDIAVLRPNISLFRQSTSSIEANNLEVINSLYNKKEVIKKHPLKWFNIKYNKNIFSTFLQLPYTKFTGFLNQHLPNAYLKNTYKTLWDEEYELLNKTCKNKFRDGRDVNQWLFRYTQLVQGNFIPKSSTTGKTYNFTNNNDDIYRAIQKQKYKMICINDNDFDPVKNVEKEKEKINNEFQLILPQKSDFEKNIENNYGE